MSRDWMKQNPAYSVVRIKKEIGGTLMAFQPVTSDMIFMMRHLAKPLARVMTQLFSAFDGSSTKDQNISQRTLKNAETGEDVVIIDHDAVSVDILRERYSQRMNMSEHVVDVLTGEDTRAVLGCLILDSIKPDSDEDPITMIEGTEFIRRLPTPMLIEYLSAVKEANKQSFGPFLQGLSAMMGQAKGRLMDRLTPTTPTQPTEESPGGPTSPSNISSDDVETPRDIPKPMDESQAVSA